MFEEAYESGTLPPTLRTALITLIPKPGKPPTERGSYRPISLMCCDTKILCKALARRLERYVPSLIPNDQNGFVLGRQAFHNIRRLLNILYEKYDAKDNAILSLDAEKAFDRIEWKYLMEVLARFGLGDSYLKWLRLLYTNPTAEILKNNQISQPFRLHRGTRQGCPLSPLLFLFAIEPLALAIRQHPRILGVKIKETEHKISLFADDVIIYLTSLASSIPVLVEVIETFGKFSGYRVNKSKSNILFLNKNERQSPQVISPFLASQRGFTYLGVNIVPEIENIVASNYDPLVQSITESLNRWMLMPISMLGRINVLKMSILPKFLHLFQYIPLLYPTSTVFFFVNSESCSQILYGAIDVQG